MHWLVLVSYFFGGVLAANAVPHFVSGVMGRPFQSPFATPPGRGLSTAVVNVLWGWANGVAAYFLVFRVGTFDVRSVVDAGVLALGVLFVSLPSSWHFGQFHGGNVVEG